MKVVLNMNSGSGSIIESSYKIPFINEPENIIWKNNKSALVKKNPVDIKFSAHDACRE